MSWQVTVWLITSMLLAQMGLFAVGVTEAIDANTAAVEACQ